MHRLVGNHVVSGQLTWQDLGNWRDRTEEVGLKITFPFYRKLSRFDANKFLEDSFVKNDVPWLRRSRKGWYLNADLFKDKFPAFRSEGWLRGNVLLEAEIDYSKEKVMNFERDRTHLTLLITSDMVEEQMPKRIFLSHKGVNKPMVREYKAALEAVGLSPWLDEDAMHAGVELERGILQGFEDSCAAIFFITKDFKDEDFLASEVNYAVQEKRKKKERFSIITLVLAESTDDEEKIKVPSLLRSYVWKKPTSSLVALVEILKALPLQVGELDWK